ncbi:MAG: hypothetical protein ACYDER_20635 [Ktedonobacteraceae bacterium]
MHEHRQVPRHLSMLMHYCLTPPDFAQLFKMNAPISQRGYLGIMRDHNQRLAIYYRF